MPVRFAVVGGVGQLRPGAVRAAGAACHLGVPDARRHEVELAVHEGLANALEHGHLGDPTQPIDVEVAAHDPGTVTVRITDGAFCAGGRRRGGSAAGDGADPEPRGRGWQLILAATDRVGEGSEEGTLVLQWSVGGSSSGTSAGPDREDETWHG